MFIDVILNVLVTTNLVSLRMELWAVCPFKPCSSPPLKLGMHMLLLYHMIYFVIDLDVY
jgi:hypothetical protein